MRIPKLPYPPTVNTYWRSLVVRGRVKLTISKRGRAYKRAVQIIILEARAKLTGLPRKPLAGRLGVFVTVHQPNDKRKRDLGNLDKALFDALEKSAIYNDDEQIDFIAWVRGEKSEDPHVLVDIIEIDTPAVFGSITQQMRQLFTDIEKTAA